jgi:hypothetical protein
MGVYVKNGTPLDGPALCETCSYAFIRLGYRVGEEVVMCRWTEPVTRVEFRVRECTAYHDKTRPNMYQMEQLAWIVSPDRSKELTGFGRSTEKSKEAGSIELIVENED